MNITVRLSSGSVIDYTGEDYHYLNWLDQGETAIILLQHTKDGKKEVVKFPHHNLVYLHVTDEPELFDALKEIVG